MECFNAVEAAEKWSRSMINYYCSEGCIPDAQKLRGIWITPKDAMKPAGRRNQQRKYLGGCADGENKNA